MSIRAITAALELAPAIVTSTERLVLVALAWHADEHGRNAWPAVTTIARKTSLTDRAVQKALRRLAGKGLVFLQGRSTRGSVRYGVDLEVLDRERGSQSGGDDRERGSQSADLSDTTTANVVHQGVNVVHPTANVVHRGGERGSPDPSLIRPLTVNEEVPAARSAQRHGASAQDQDRKEGRRTYVVPAGPHRNGSAADAGAARRASAPPAAPPVNSQDAKKDAKKAEADADTIAAYIAHDTFDTLGDDAPFPALAEAFTTRLNGHPGAAHILDNLGPFLYGIRKRRRQHARA